MEILQLSVSKNLVRVKQGSMFLTRPQKQNKMIKIEFYETSQSFFSLLSFYSRKVEVL